MTINGFWKVNLISESECQCGGRLITTSKLLRRSSLPARNLHSWSYVKSMDTRFLKEIEDFVLALTSGKYIFKSQGFHLTIWFIFSIVMNQCLAASSSAGQYGQRKGGPLLILFYKLCRLLRAPVSIIFVFDGPQRPAGKRGRILKLQSVPSWKEDCKELIESFGFHYYEVGFDYTIILGWLVLTLYI